MESDFTLALRVVEAKETRRSCASGLGYLRKNLLPAHTVRHHDSWSCCAVARFRKRTSTQTCVYTTICYASPRVIVILITGFIGWLKLH